MKLRAVARGIVLICTLTSPIVADTDRLINGQPANKADWPSSVYASIGGSACSATVVGYRVLMIASHCVDNGGTANFTVNGAKYNANCTHGPGYPGNSTADWSLCLTDSIVSGGPFESVNYDPARFKVGDKLMLSGYGCVKPGGGGGNDGVLRVGESTIQKLPSGNNNDIVTKGGAALCFGDSGGAAYYVDGRDGRRWVVGINSRGDIKTTSYLSSVSTDAAKKFINEWADKNDQLICGIHLGAGDCRY